jgi:hypothetical protein
VSGFGYQIVWGIAMAERIEADYKKMLSQIDVRVSLEVEKLCLLLDALRSVAYSVEEPVA